MRCPVCEKDIKGDSWNFKRHFEQQHSSTKGLNCPFCPKTYKKAGTLRNHVQNKHEEEEVGGDIEMVSDEEEEQQENDDEEEEEENVLPPNPLIESEAIEDNGNECETSPKKKIKLNQVSRIKTSHLIALDICLIVLL